MQDDQLERVRKDIDEMNKVFDMRDDVDKVKTDPPSTDPPEEIKTDPPATSPPQDVETDSPKTEPPSTDQPEDKDEIIRKLREKLADKDKEETPKTDPPATTPPATSAPIQPIDFVGDLDLDDLRDDKEEMNKLFNRIYQEAAKVEGVQQGPELLAAIPQLVATVTALQKASEDFYKDNEDLVPFKKVVGATFEELVAKNPDKTYDEITKDIAPLVRQKLELPDPKKKGKDTPPRLPKRKAKPGKVDDDNINPTSTQSQIDEMNKSLGR